MKQVGNVTADSELTYEYGVRRTAAKPQKKLTAQPKKEEKEKEEDDGDVVKSKGNTHTGCPLLIIVFLLLGESRGASSSSDNTVPPQIINGQPHLPFQLQIEYTNSDGDRCLRVITKAKPITTDRLKAEKGELIVDVMLKLLLLSL